MLKSTLALTAASLLTLSGAAHAQSATDILFKYSGYELKADAGAMAVYERIETKAKLACETGWRDLRSERLERACEKKLRADFAAQINHPQLSRIHNRSGDAQRFAEH